MDRKKLGLPSAVILFSFITVFVLLRLLSREDTRPEVVKRVAEKTLKAAVSSADPSKADNQAKSLQLHLREGENPRALASTYRASRNNILFDEKQFLADARVADKKLLQHISDELHNTNLLMSLADEDYYKTRPPILLERMAMMDMLRGFFENDFDASVRAESNNALSQVIDSSIPKNTPDYIKKILATEKYDAMRILAQYDPEAAYDKYSRLSNETLKHILLSALESGLEKTTTTTDKVVQIKQQLFK